MGRPVKKNLEKIGEVINVITKLLGINLYDFNIVDSKFEISCDLKFRMSNLKLG